MKKGIVSRGDNHAMGNRTSKIKNREWEKGEYRSPEGGPTPVNAGFRMGQENGSEQVQERPLNRRP